MSHPVRVAAPSETLLSLLDIKAHCVVSHNDDDAYLIALGGAAEAWLDGYSGVLGRCLVSQEWRTTLAAWGDVARLPFADVTAVALTYSDASGVTQTLPTDQYALLTDGLGSYVEFLSAFTAPALNPVLAEPVTVTFTAGYGTASNVPLAVRHAAKMLVAHWYDNRSAVDAGGLSDMPMAVNQILAPFRRVHV